MDAELVLVLESTARLQISSRRVVSPFFRKARTAGLVRRRGIVTREIVRERPGEFVYFFQRNGAEQTQHWL